MSEITISPYMQCSVFGVTGLNVCIVVVVEDDAKCDSSATRLQRLVSCGEG